MAAIRAAAAPHGAGRHQEAEAIDRCFGQVRIPSTPPPPQTPLRRTAPAPVLERARAVSVPERASCGARRQSTAEEILAALEATDTDWSRRTLARVRLMSPASLAATMELFRRGAACGLEECLRAEFRLAHTCAACSPAPPPLAWRAVPPIRRQRPCRARLARGRDVRGCVAWYDTWRRGAAASTRGRTLLRACGRSRSTRTARRAGRPRLPRRRCVRLCTRPGDARNRARVCGRPRAGSCAAG